MESRQIFKKNLGVLSMYNAFDFASFYIDTNLSQIGKKCSLGLSLSELVFTDKIKQLNLNYDTCLIARVQNYILINGYSYLF